MNTPIKESHFNNYYRHFKNNVFLCRIETHDTMTFKERNKKFVFLYSYTK